jgi:molecular chaperone DnaK (HSP70)
MSLYLEEGCISNWFSGGSPFVPLIRKPFEHKFGGETPIRAGQEFTSVAEGLAIHALELSA